MCNQPKENSVVAGQAATKQRKPAGAAGGFRDNRPVTAAQRKLCGVIQRATSIPTVPVFTDYGKFEATTYEITDAGNGVNIALKFSPSGRPGHFAACTKVVDATKIGMVQSCCAKDASGVPYAADPRVGKRMVKHGRGKGFKIDRIGDYNVPVYGVTEPGIRRLEDVPPVSDDAGTLLDPRSSPNYDLGVCERASHRYKPAKMRDTPAGHADIEFETTALALEGTDKDTYYGSVKWGFTYTGGVLTPLNISLASNGAPSRKFMKAAELWNKRGHRKRKSGQTFTSAGTIQVDKVYLPKNTKWPFRWSVNWNLKKLSLLVNGSNRNFYVDKSKIDTHTDVVQELVSLRLPAPVTIPAGTASIKYRENLQRGGRIGFLANVPHFSPMVFIESSEVKVNHDGTKNVPLPLVP